MKLKTTRFLQITVVNLPWHEFCNKTWIPPNDSYSSFKTLFMLQTSLPLSAAVFRGPKSVIPMSPPRLDVQVLAPCHWSRVPNIAVNVHTMKLSDIRGHSMLCEKPGKMETCYSGLRIDFHFV